MKDNTQPPFSISEDGDQIKHSPVKANTDAASKLKELFEDELKDIYWAEKALIKAIPKMIENASDKNLVAALTEHLAVTDKQIGRAEKVFLSIGVNAQTKKCEAMDGLIMEAEEIMKETEDGMVRDAGIISAAQKIEHYEIATYGTLRSFAITLGFAEAAELLEESLNEEKEADASLSQIAETSINIGAL